MKTEIRERRGASPANCSGKAIFSTCWYFCRGLHGKTGLAGGKAGSKTGFIRARSGPVARKEGKLVGLEAGRMHP